MKSGKNILRILCIICLLQVLFTIYLILKVYVSNVLRPDILKELEQDDQYENSQQYNSQDFILEESKSEQRDSRTITKHEIFKTERVLLRNIMKPDQFSHGKVEIWGKAAIASYLWQHILGGSKSVKIENPSLYTGELTAQKIHIVYKEGPGLQFESPSNNLSCLIVILNGRSSAKALKSKEWLKSLNSFTLRLKVVLVMLGNEQCENKWIEDFLYPKGPVMGVFLTYDDMRVDNERVFQWPLGVATYRNFPLLSEKEINSTRIRKFSCNLQATNYVNSSRSLLFSLLNSYPISKKNCVIKERKQWLSSESLASSKQYLELLMESDLTLCPAGFNTETYRVYEALEAGSVPVIEDTASKGSCDIKTGWRLLKSFHPPVIWIRSWNELPKILRKEQKMSSEAKTRRRKHLLSWYRWFKLRNRDNFLSFLHMQM